MQPLLAGIVIPHGNHSIDNETNSVLGIVFCQADSSRIIRDFVSEQHYQSCETGVAMHRKDPPKTDIVDVPVGLNSVQLIMLIAPGGPPCESVVSLRLTDNGAGTSSNSGAVRRLKQAVLIMKHGILTWACWDGTQIVCWGTVGEAIWVR
jgi:hypothetical protein